MTDTREIELKLEAVRARRNALADAAAARLEPGPEELLATEERRLAEDEAFELAQSEHGARCVALVRTDDCALVLRRPHVAAFRKFQDAGGMTSQVAEELVKSCLLYPTKPEFDKACRALPGLLTKAANACVELAGFQREDIKGK